VLLAFVPAGVWTQGPPRDGVLTLLGRLERAIMSGDTDAYLRLLADSADRERAAAAASALMVPGITRAVVKERDRTDLTGTLPGDGYQLLAEVFTERGARGRIATWRFDVRRTSSDDADWRIAAQDQVSLVDGLYHLSLDAQKQYVVRDLELQAEDLEIRLRQGSVFVTSVDAGVTGLVLLGEGTMLFRPTPEAERGQVRIFSGADTIDSRFDTAFVRISPDEYENRLSASVFTERRPDPAELRRAEAVFRDEVSKSFSFDLSDLSRESWSLLPPRGDFLAEIRTRRFGVLTYARSGNQAEDITVFNRRQRRNISVYASQSKLAQRGLFYDEDALADYDVLEYDVEASFTPERVWIDGRTRMRLRIRDTSVNTLNVKLADNLTVRSVYSAEFGRLLALRVRNQAMLVVNLPAPLRRDAELNLTVTYAGTLAPQAEDREAIGAFDAADQGQSASQGGLEGPPLLLEPGYLYSNRSLWYAQAPSTDYAPATLQLTVPEAYESVASGHMMSGSPVKVDDTGPPRKRYNFVATQPLRYLSWLITRLETAGAKSVRSIQAPEAAPGPAPNPWVGPRRPGVYYDAIDLQVLAHPRLMSRAWRTIDPASEILQFYSTLLGDCPYPTMTVALVEKELPGGHSPAYMATVNQPLPGSPLVWGDDPAAFQNYPEFFLAHELAHQWWGQAVGWKNYHEQWLSEGFAQYFAAMYAERARGPQTFGDIMRRMTRWGANESDQGPVHLGYRLGHTRGESRVFRALVYNKAAATLHMLRRMLGDEAFFRGLRRLYDGFRFQKAGTEDVREAFQSVTERPLGRFFQRWIYGSTLPNLRFSYRLDAVTPSRVIVRVEQTSETFDLPLTVTLHFTDGTTSDTTIVVDDRVVERAIPVTKALRNVTADRDELVMGRVERASRPS
jgi:hypothetical protein